MQSARSVAAEIALWAACGSATAILFSIAVSQSLLGIAIAAMLVARTRIRLPRVWLPLALFLLGTLLSLLLSGDPRAGLPQVKKFYVYLTLPVIYSLVRKISLARNLLLTWSAAAGITSVIGIFQFMHKWRTAKALHYQFYEYYLNARITGTMGHWMTFSGEEMLALIILIAYLLFAKLPRRVEIAGWIVVGISTIAALLLSDTRSVWIATFAAALYLVFLYRKRLVLVVPVVALLALAAAPATIRDRMVSIVQPHGTVDSNAFRFVVWRTGLKIIEAHPFFGLGPEMVHKHFYEWLPADTPRPLPTGYYGHLHSIYVHYAAERGVPTMLMLLWMLGWIVYDCARTLRRMPAGRGDARFLLHAGIACVGAILIEGFFELNLGDSEVLTMFLVLTACAYRAVDAERKPLAIKT